MPYASIEHDRARKQRWKKANPTKCNSLARRTYAYKRDNDPKFYEKRRATAKKWRKVARPRVKREVIEHYGGKCKCCGEDRLPFLNIDHPKNDGGKHRKLIANGGVASGWKTYHWLRVNNFPKGFRVLCFNCNIGRHINGGKCPHKDKRWIK